MDHARKSNFKHHHVCNNLFRARFVIMRLRPAEPSTLYIYKGGFPFIAIEFGGLVVDAKTSLIRKV